MTNHQTPPPFILEEALTPGRWDEVGVPGTSWLAQVFRDPSVTVVTVERSEDMVSYRRPRVYREMMEADRQADR